jgi:hypothetical protein
MTRPVGFETPPDRAARLSAFAEGYGAPIDQLVESALQAQHAEIRRIADLGGAGVEPWATFLRRGLGETAQTELAWLEANLGRLA